MLNVQLTDKNNKQHYIIVDDYAQVDAYIDKNMPPELAPYKCKWVPEYLVEFQCLYVFFDAVGLVNDVKPAALNHKQIQGFYQMQTTLAKSKITANLNEILQGCKKIIYTKNKKACLVINLFDKQQTKEV